MPLSSRCNGRRLPGSPTEAILRFSLMVLPLSLLSACEPAPESVAEVDPVAITEGVRLATMALCDSWNTLNPDIHGLHYSDDMRWGGGGSFLVGEDFREAMAGFMGMFSEYDQRCQQPDIQVLGPDAAVAGVIVSFTRRDEDGEASEGTEAMTLVWRRFEQGWRVVHGHTSAQEA